MAWWRRRRGRELNKISEADPRALLPADAALYRDGGVARDLVVIILTTGSQIDCCFMLDALKEVDGVDWIRKGVGLSNVWSLLPSTRTPNVCATRIAMKTCPISGSGLAASSGCLSPGLDRYRKTLMALTAYGIEQQIEAIEEEVTNVASAHFAIAKGRGARQPSFLTRIPARNRAERPQQSVSGCSCGYLPPPHSLLQVHGPCLPPPVVGRRSEVPMH